MCISRTTTSKTAATFKPSAHLWRFRTTREFDNKNKARRESLRGPRDGQSVFGNACGSSANQKKNALAFAGLPQIKKRTLWRLRDSRKSKKERFGACGSSANQKENALAFAGLPQIKKRTLWRLRKFRKSKRERFGVCGSSANQKKNVLALAEVPQIKKRTLWRLRDSRKSKKERFGACGIPANRKENVLALAEVPRGISKNTLVVTALYPSHSSGIRSLILSFKLTLQRFLEREIRRRGHPFRSDRSLGGHRLLRSIFEVPI